MGTFLTWMQEKEEPVFVLATSNNIDQLPPEMLRKGRFDEIFFVDLPGANTRSEILDIHLKKKGRHDEAETFDLNHLAEASVGYSVLNLKRQSRTLYSVRLTQVVKLRSKTFCEHWKLLIRYRRRCVRTSKACESGPSIELDWPQVKKRKLCLQMPKMCLVCQMNGAIYSLGEMLHDIIGAKRRWKYV